MKQKELHIAIDETLSELLAVASSFEQEQFNIVPFKDSWTAGEVTQHLVLSISGFVELLKGPAQDTKRKPDEHIENIKTDFLNFSIKFKSPDPVVPEKKAYYKEDQLRRFKELKIELENIIETANLNQTCTLFEIPGGLGYLTRQEALAFVIYHTQRHIHQLRKIKNSLTEGSSTVGNLQRVRLDE